ncbi:hypothetical protein ACEWY4_020430 [Coilia grayii]|uniref:TNFR-Cys domain-containing protein n=1 Tax=Coilia grayii TaxID=363190 RepID=A0ABD1JCW4_9TELE
MGPAKDTGNCKPGYYSSGNDTHPCVHCPEGQYSDENNSLDHCLVCRNCHNQHLRPKRECKSDRNALCECKEGYYCTDGKVESCSHCMERTECPPGQGAVNTGAPEDTKCASCPEGFFSNVTDYYSPCIPHTNCTGKELKWKGNATTDSVCDQLGPPVCPSPPHPWMLPAGLWVGLIISAIIFVAYIYWKTRRQSRRTVSITDDHGGNISPALAPDILPPPLELKDYKVEATETPLLSSSTPPPPLLSCAVETSSSSMPCMCTLECDGVASPTVTSPTSPMRLNPLAVACGQAGESIGSSVCHSEPQEDEWPIFSSSVNLGEGKLCI